MSLPHFLCYRGDGSCKHVAALLFGLVELSRQLRDRSVISVTDQPAKWVEPTRTSAPVKATDLDLRKQPTGPQKVDPSSKDYVPVPASDPVLIEKELFKRIKQHNIHAVCLYGLSDSASSSEEDFERYPLNLVDVAKTYKGVNEDFDTFLCQQYSETVCAEIENLSKKQAECDFWFYQRMGRLTASVFHEAAHFRSFDKPDASLLRKIFGHSDAVCPATQYGKQNEHKAKQEYEKKVGNVHQNFTVTEAGLHIKSDLALLGASPDGLLDCACHGKGVLEIKCAYSHKKLPAKAAAKLRPENFVVKGEDVSLKKDISSPFYCQIIGQMALTNTKYCDFVLFTNKNVAMYVERVHFDSKFWDSLLLPKLLKFCDLSLKPKLLNS